MKKRYILVMVAALGIALILAACSDNADTGMSDDAADTLVENQVNTQGNTQENTQEENMSVTQQNSESTPVENDFENEEENKNASQQNSEFTSDDHNLESNEEKEGQSEMKMNVQVGDYNFTATLENNEAVEELLDMMKEGPVTIQMDDYSGFEKVGSLGRSLTTSNSQTTTAAGDIVLYNGNNIVMFYGSNSWSYTRIGKIDDLTDWEKALGSGNITVVFSVGE